MDFDTLVIGAGVVGLAIAAELAPSTGSLLVLEQHSRFGQETSSHNSEVLHAGLYYPTGSLKTRLCLSGNQMLQALARDHDIPLKLTGKLVVGDAGDEAALETLMARALANGVEGLKRLSVREIRALEPALSSTCALFSANTGILDSHALMRWYLCRATEHGADLVYDTRVIGLEPIDGGYRIDAEARSGERCTIDARRVINAAGLNADLIAAMAGIDLERAGYRLHRCKGDYFSTHPRCWPWVSHLIYPVPGAHAAGLGIHVTLDLDGRLRLGPDTTWLTPDEASSYAVNADKRGMFAAAVQRYLPALQPSDLEPEFAGIRPKLQSPGGPVRDFVIAEESARGLPGFVNLIGIESPGLPASPAIAREVRRLLEA